MATHLESNNVLLHHRQQDQKKPRPQPEQSPKCPRCDSTNTKFCYYNNYSLSQPRYFCKSCRRYWTKGGSLRNVPVGGGCRKNHRRTPNPNSSSKQNNKQDQELSIPALPPLTFDPNELSVNMLANPNPNPNSDVAGFLDILRNGINASGQFHEYYGNSTGTTSTGLMMFPNFDGGLIKTETAATVVTTATASDALGDNVGCENNMWDHGHHHHHHYHHGNLGVEWSGMQQGASSWHGIINSSLM